MSIIRADHCTCPGGFQAAEATGSHPQSDCPYFGEGAAMTDDIVDAMRQEQSWLGNHEDALDCPFQESQNLLIAAADSIERLRRILHRYGDRIPMATCARPDWQQEIDEAFEWVANNPDPLPGWTEKGHAWLDAGCPPIATKGEGS